MYNDHVTLYKSKSSTTDPALQADSLPTHQESSSGDQQGATLLRVHQQLGEQGAVQGLQPAGG